MWVRNFVGEWGDCAEGLVPERARRARTRTRRPRSTTTRCWRRRSANGGPTVYDRSHPPPAWDGYYNSRGLQQKQWSFGNNVQSATLMQVLTPEYQRRFAQALYHVAVSNSSQWVSSTCYPEGLIRWWAQGVRDVQVSVTPYQVQLLSGTALNILRQVLIGQKHVAPDPAVVRRDGRLLGRETLVAWTANVQGWWMSHALPEFSSKLEAIEVYTRDSERNLHLEITLYDPAAFVGSAASRRALHLPRTGRTPTRATSGRSASRRSGTSTAGCSR